jgi:anti-anti-sigma regulatory factor
MKDFVFEQTGGIGLLHFFGDLSENYADKLRQGFMVSFESADYVVVNFTKVTGFDAGCFSLFCAANRIFSRCNKRLFLVGLTPKVSETENAFGRTVRPTFCVSECREGCLWKG